MVMTTLGEQKTKFAVAGAATIALSIKPGRPFKLKGLHLHLNAAPTTSENFTVTLNAGEGSNFDTVLFSRDLTNGSITDMVWEPINADKKVYLAGDQIDVAWTNTNTKTYGLLVEIEVC